MPTAPVRAAPGSFSFVGSVAMNGMRSLAALLVAALAVGVATGAERVDPVAAATAIVEATNAFRAAHGRARVARDPALAQAAQRFAEYMGETDRYGHDADGRRPAERVEAHGYDYCAVAENIALQYSSSGFATDELVARVIEGWQQSPGHRQNMLLPNVVDIGIGVARSARTQRWYAVQLFARPKRLAVRFEVANRTGVAIDYAVGGQRHTLPPRVTRTHHGCFTGAVEMTAPGGEAGPGFEPRDGARYTIVRDAAGQLRVQVPGT